MAWIVVGKFFIFGRFKIQALRQILGLHPGWRFEVLLVTPLEPNRAISQNPQMRVLMCYNNDPNTLKKRLFI